MSLPLSIILLELENVSNSIIPILSTLYYDKSILSSIGKSDLKHLVSRTMNLAKSPNHYKKWCGINLIRVLSNDYNILANEGVAMMGQLLKIFETYNETLDRKLLTSAIEALNFMCDKIRGKPTLTREILTPKLSTIISYYMDHLHHVPLLILESLLKIMKNHPTTFRPFGNKLGSKLITLLSSPESQCFPINMRNKIFEVLATLPVIEKTEPENVWAQNVQKLIKETVSVAQIYGEFFNLNDDGDFQALIKKLPTFEEGEKGFFPDLIIDVNEPISIYQISQRIDTLLTFLKYYLITETQYGVRVPLGSILILIEVICTINARFLTIKSDIRDDLVKETIRATTIANQVQCVNLIDHLVLKYKGNILPHFSNILSFLEVLIPFKNKGIDYTALIVNEKFCCDVLECVSNILSLLSNLGDSSQLLRFVDAALLLVEPRLNESQPTNKNNKNIIANNKKANKRRKNNSSVPLADLLSHEDLFADTIPKSTITKVRSFLSTVITRSVLPSTQHYKIMRYLIIEAVNASYYNLDKRVPKELRNLLVNAVLYPGFEKISLLPIATSILKDDPLLSVFNNPRFPPSPVYIKNFGSSVNDIESESDDEEEEGEQPEPKRQKITTEPVRTLEDISSSATDVEMLESTAAEKGKIFSKETEVLEFKKPDTSIAIQENIKNKETSSTGVSGTDLLPESQSSSYVSASTNITSIATEEASDDGSDFDMPAIDLDDDSDDE